MSLVSDALRKARREAAEKERRAQGLDLPHIAPPPAGGGRLGSGLVIGAAVAIAAAVIGGAIAMWVLDVRPQQQEVRTANTEKADAGAAPQGTEAAPAVEEFPPDPPPAEPERAIPEVGSMTEPPAVEEMPAEGDESREEVVAEVVAPLVVAEEPGPDVPPSSATAGERDVVGEARIGDVTLSLGYLIYRETAPFAQINGVDVRVGAVIEGFVVEEILRDRVVLRDDAGPLVIRVE